MLEQVFNTDETGLFWKRIPYLPSQAGKIGVQRSVVKDRVTLLRCGNAAGKLRRKANAAFLTAETPYLLVAPHSTL